MRGLRFLIPFVACVLAGSAAPASTGLTIVDHVVVDKTARTLVLYMQGQPVRAITGIQLGDAPLGHKRFQGDERTPEGRYVIDWANPDSSFHLSLRISYPNAADRAYAASFARNPGGMIMIHGQPNGMRGRMQGDWTDGCIALSNEEMEYVWQTVPNGTVIDILP